MSKSLLVETISRNMRYLDYDIRRRVGTRSTDVWMKIHNPVWGWTWAAGVLPVKGAIYDAVKGKQ